MIVETVMKHLTRRRDIENLCLAGGIQVRKTIFRKKKLLRNEKTLNILNRILIEQLFEKHSLTIGNLFILFNCYRERTNSFYF